MYRPDGWTKCPCDDCSLEMKCIDQYGYMCDLSCGKRSAWANYELGADAMLAGLEPLIRKMSPYGKLVDILYPKEEK